MSYNSNFFKSRDTFFFAVLEFDHAVPVVPKGLVIGSKFDTDIHSNTCRIAFRGSIHFVFGDENYLKGDLSRLKVYKTKCRVSYRQLIFYINIIPLKSLINEYATTKM